MLRRIAFFAVVASAAVVQLTALGFDPHARAEAGRPCLEEDRARLSKLLDADERRVEVAQNALDRQQVYNANFFLEKGALDPESDRQLRTKTQELKDAKQILAKDRAAFEACMNNQSGTPEAPAPPLQPPVPADQNGGEGT